MVAIEVGMVIALLFVSLVSPALWVRHLFTELENRIVSEIHELRAEPQEDKGSESHGEPEVSNVGEFWSRAGSDVYHKKTCHHALGCKPLRPCSICH